MLLQVRFVGATSSFSFLFLGIKIFWNCPSTRLGRFVCCDFILFYFIHSPYTTTSKITVLRSVNQLVKLDCLMELIEMFKRKEEN